MANLDVLDNTHADEAREIQTRIQSKELTTRDGLVEVSSGYIKVLDNIIKIIDTHGLDKRQEKEFREINIELIRVARQVLEYNKAINAAIKRLPVRKKKA